jgi:hypothetical protein
MYVLDCFRVQTGMTQNSNHRTSPSWFQHFLYANGGERLNQPNLHHISILSIRRNPPLPLIQKIGPMEAGIAFIYIRLGGIEAGIAFNYIRLAGSTFKTGLHFFSITGSYGSAQQCCGAATIRCDFYSETHL